MLRAMKKRAVLGLGLIAAGSLTTSVWSGCTATVRTYGTGGSGGGASSSSSSGTGGMAGCMTGDIVSCYDGPPGTEGVGICVAGTATCGADGKPGACGGQVLPNPQPDCTMHQDQDCDGVPDFCSLDLVWGHAYMPFSGNDNIFQAVAADDAGNVFVAGHIDGSVDFGMGAVSTSGMSNDEDVIFAKLDPKGGTVFTRKLGDTVNQQAMGIAVDGKGSVYVAGNYAGAMNVGPNFILPTAGTDQDTFLIKFDNTGAPQWQRTGSGVDDQNVTAVAASPKGGVVVGGGYYGSFAWTGGGANVTVQPPFARNLYVQRFGENASSVFTMTTNSVAGDGGPSGYQDLNALAVDANGDVIIAGYFDGTIGFPNGATYSTAGQQDIFVAKLNGQDGSVVWTQTFGGPSDDEPRGLAIAPNGDILLSGYFSTGISIGPFPISTAGATGMFLTRLGGDGSVQWARAYGASGISGMFVNVDNVGNLVLHGYFNGTADFGGPLFDSGVPASDFGAAMFLAKLDPSGAHLGSRIFGQAGFGVFFGGAIVPKTNRIVVSGATLFPLDLGDGVPQGAQQLAAPLVAEYAP